MIDLLFLDLLGQCAGISGPLQQGSDEKRILRDESLYMGMKIGAPGNLDLLMRIIAKDRPQERNPTRKKSLHFGSLEENFTAMNRMSGKRYRVRSPG